jgi:hypothetical protein
MGDALSCVADGKLAGRLAHELGHHPLRGYRSDLSLAIEGRLAQIDRRSPPLLRDDDGDRQADHLDSAAASKGSGRARRAQQRERRIARAVRSEATPAPAADAHEAALRSGA